MVCKHIIDWEIFLVWSWHLATFYLHMAWLTNKCYLPVFLESSKWAWGFFVWTQIIYRSLGWVKLSSGNLLKWIETIHYTAALITVIGNTFPTRFPTASFLKSSFTQSLLPKSSSKMSFKLFNSHFVILIFILFIKYYVLILVADEWRIRYSLTKFPD